MARMLNKDPAAYRGERDVFLKDLKRFHENKGTPYRHLPTIDGKEIDLYQLYWMVTAHGGWEKVNSIGGWDELVSLFDISESTANGALAIKQIYLRYLDSYEKIHFLGEEEDGGDDNWYNNAEDSRSRRQKAQKITVPLVYNQSQQKVGDENRAALHLSTNVYRKNDYDRLMLSLTSPLPNEQDMAINVCTLLSNEGRHTLKLAKCPRLLDLLLSHAGVFNHDNIKTYMNELYVMTRNYDLLGFWNNVCKDRSVRKLILQYSKEPTRWSTHNDFLALRTAKERLEGIHCCVKEELVTNVTEGSEELFATGIQVGTQELSGQRILQVATIVHNLSFEEDNALILARNVTLLRFCLLCCSTQWSNLNQLGFDILSNVASEVILEEQSESCVTNVMLSTLTICIASSDRFQVMSSLDIINKLCQQEANKQLIRSVLVAQQSVYDQLVTYLSLHDIHLLISTLECLYSLSCLGETTCNMIVRTHGALDVLVSLVTVEAQSYGPKACILMRVVETVPGATSAVTVSQHSNLQVQTQHQVPTSSLQTQGVSFAQNTQQTPVATVSGFVVQQQQQNHARGQLLRVQVSAINILPLPRPPMPNVCPEQHLPTVPRQIVAIHQHLNQQQVVQLQQPLPGVTEQIMVRPQAFQMMLQQQQQAVRFALQQKQQQTPHPQPLRQLQPVHLSQQQQQQQSGSQQVQLRVCNDEPHRTFCLSWLLSTYESATGCHIQHEIMYKQYLVSLHKLGKRDVISAQHYAACVRSLFGGSVGPNKRQLPGGKVDKFFEGVKVRLQPLPNNPLPSQVPIVPTQQVASASHAAASVTPLVQRLQDSKVVRQSMPQAATTQISQHPNTLTDAHPAANDVTEQEENGISVLDGILPKDPQFGQIKEAGVYGNAWNGKLTHILEKKPLQNHMVNGKSGNTEEGIDFVPNNHLKELNGDGHSGDNGPMSSNLKRPASSNLNGATVAKNLMMAPSPEVLVVNDLDPILKKDVNLSQAAQRSQLLPSVTLHQYQPAQKHQRLLIAVDEHKTLHGHQLQVKGVSGQVHVNGTREAHQEQPIQAQARQQTPPSSLGLALVPPTRQNPGVIAAPTLHSTTSVPSVMTMMPVSKPNPQIPFLCEWQGCMKAFKTPKEVENHVIKVHCPLGQDDIPCLWLHCDGMMRKRFSLMTHIQDRHCHPQLMKLMAVRRVQMARTGKSEVPLPPVPPTHPGCAPNAAYQAIKRHATEFANPKALALGDKKEGPVTKSIRLTSSLILKNLVIYSSLGKKRLKAYESHLSTVALSNVEASRTASQILFEMAQHEDYD